MMGALPICSDLPVFRETLGNRAVYLSVTEAYPWADTIRKHVPWVSRHCQPCRHLMFRAGLRILNEWARALRGIERKGHA